MDNASNNKYLLVLLVILELFKLFEVFVSMRVLNLNTIDMSLCEYLIHITNIDLTRLTQYSTHIVLCEASTCEYSKHIFLIFDHA